MKYIINLILFIVEWIVLLPINIILIHWYIPHIVASYEEYKYLKSINTKIKILSLYSFSRKIRKIKWYKYKKETNLPIGLFSKHLKYRCFNGIVNIHKTVWILSPIGYLISLIIIKKKYNQINRYL